jgi:hypothetical protein
MEVRENHRGINYETMWELLNTEALYGNMCEYKCT